MSFFLFWCMRKFGYYSVHHFCEQLSLKLVVFTMLQLFIVLIVTFLTEVYRNLHLYF